MNSSYKNVGQSVSMATYIILNSFWFESSRRTLIGVGKMERMGKEVFEFKHVLFNLPSTFLPA